MESPAVGVVPMIKTEVVDDGYEASHSDRESMENDWSKKRSKLHSLLFGRKNSPVPPEFRSASPAANVEAILDSAPIKSEPEEPVIDNSHQSQDHNTQPSFEITNTARGMLGNSLLPSKGTNDNVNGNLCKPQKWIMRDTDSPSLLKSVLTCPMDMLGKTGLMDSPPAAHSPQSHSRTQAFRDAELRKMLAAPINTSYNSGQASSPQSLFHSVLNCKPESSSNSPLQLFVSDDAVKPSTSRKTVTKSIASIVDEEISKIHSDSNGVEKRLNGHPVKTAKIAKHVSNLSMYETPPYGSTCDATLPLTQQDNNDVKTASDQHTIVYKCEICDMTFQHKGTLKVHRRGHYTEEKKRNTCTKVVKSTTNGVTETNSLCYSLDSNDMTDTYVKIEVVGDESPVHVYESSQAETLINSFTNEREIVSSHVDKQQQPNETETDQYSLTSNGHSASNTEYSNNYGIFESKFKQTSMQHSVNMKRKFTDDDYNAGDMLETNDEAITKKTKQHSVNMKRKLTDDDYNAGDMLETKDEAITKKTKQHSNTVICVERETVNKNLSLLSQLIAGSKDKDTEKKDFHTNQHMSKIYSHSVIPQGVTSNTAYQGYDKYLDTNVTLPGVYNMCEDVEVITVKEEVKEIDDNRETLADTDISEDMIKKSVVHEPGQGITDYRKPSLLTRMLHGNQPKATGTLDRTAVMQQQMTEKSSQSGRSLTGADKLFSDFHQQDRISNGHQDENGELTFPLYRCQTCGANFQHAGTLMVHERSHNLESKKVQCPICGKCVTDTRYLKIHIRTHKPETIPIVPASNTAEETVQSTDLSTAITPDCNSTFKCYICHLVFSNVENFQVHLRTHTDQKLFQCELCDAGFTRASQLKIHMGIHTGERPYACDVCHMTFRQKGGLKLHMSIHTQDKPYKCHLCEDSFGRKAHLDKHIRYHTGDRPYQCTECYKNFIDLGNLKQHVWWKHGFEGKMIKCYDCGKYFVSNVRLQEHVASNCIITNSSLAGQICGSDMNINSLRDGAQVKCDQCDKIFTNDIMLEDHMKFVHIDIGNNSPPKQTHLCHTCKQVFIDEKDLQTHINTNHVQKTICCPTCPKAFNYKSLLYEHMNKCHKILACPICDDKFFVISLLQEHLESHKDSKDVKPVLGTIDCVDHDNSSAKFVCNICEAVHPTEKALLTHYHQHSESIQSCDFCGMNFLTKKALTEHMNVEHENARYGCQLCGKTYKQIRYLTKHVQACHSVKQVAGESKGNNFDNRSGQHVSTEPASPMDSDEDNDDDDNRKMDGE